MGEKVGWAVAYRVLGENHPPEEMALLRTQLDELFARGRTVTDLTANENARSVEEGFTRLDALNRIGNQLFFTNLQGMISENSDATANFAPTAAPLNYPHIWDTSWFDWVQYDASIMQPMVRNAGKAQRPWEFCLGSRLFNPKEVGYSTKCVAGAFRLDTTIDGNRNTGHAFSDGPLGDGVIGRALACG